MRLLIVKEHSLLRSETDDGLNYCACFSPRLVQPYCHKTRQNLHPIGLNFYFDKRSSEYCQPFKLSPVL